MSSNTVTVLKTEQTFELPANISVREHNGGWNINICDSKAQSRTNPLGIVFSVCTKGTTRDKIAQNLEQSLIKAGAKQVAIPA
jgi:hypothetical protein